jgi:hypothetical protein
MIALTAFPGFQPLPARIRTKLKFRCFHPAKDEVLSVEASSGASPLPEASEKALPVLI